MEAIQYCMSPNDVLAYQELLDKIPGVVNTKIVLNDNGAVDELNVLAGSSRSPKQLVRDIQSALMAKYGFAVDHRTISVAQIDTEMLGEKSCPRLFCASVASSVADGRCSAHVTLKAGEEIYVGDSIGSSVLFTRNRIVATAVIEAVHQFLNRELFTVVDVKTTSIADRQAYLVAVAMQGPQGSELLLGAVCDQNFDPNETIVKATLDAINRRLPMLITL